MAVRDARHRGMEAAAEVVLATSVAVAVVLVTSRPGWALAAGLLVLTSLQAGLAAKRAYAEKGDPGQRHHSDLNMTTGEVNGGTVIGVLGDGLGVDLNLHTGAVTGSGRVIGYDRR